MNFLFKIILYFKIWFWHRII